MKKIHHILKFRNVYNEIRFLTTFPLILVIITFIIVSGAIYNNYYNTANETAATYLENFSQHCESTITNIISASAFLENDEAVAFELKNTDEVITDESIEQVKKAFANFLEIYPIVDNVFIYNQSQNAVISLGGRYNAEQYYDKYYKYNSYNVDYWKRFQFIYSYEYRVLSPSKISSNNKSDNVIPIVFKRNTFKYNSYLVVNINLDKLMANRSSYKYSSGTIFAILNRYSGEFFTENNSFISGHNSNLYDTIISGETLHKYKFDKLGRATIVTHSTSNDIVGYTYIAVIPAKDIINMCIPLFGTLILFVMMLVLMMMLATKFSTKRIYKPISNIPLENNADCNGNSLKALTSSIAKMNADSSLLKSTLSLAQEYFLINFLKSNETIDTETENTLINSLKLNDSHFQIILIRIFPTNKLKKTFSSVSYTKIQGELYNIVKIIFSEDLNCFFITTLDGELIVIANFSAENIEEVINEDLSELYGYLTQDMELIDIFVGIGSIENDITTLPDSYRNATDSLHMINAAANTNKNNKNEVNFVLSDKDEAILYNSLVASDVQSAINKFNEITKQNMYINERSLKQLYNQILFTIIKVMRIKKLLSDERLDIEIQADILSSPPDVIHHNILALINRFSNNTEFNSSVQAEDMVQYIKQNFNDPNLSLDSIASVFNAKPKYVSQMLKTSLEIGFHKYLTNLRITKAKELLTNTTLSVQEISAETGFSSMQTFFRSFKTVTGMTPSGYRETNKLK